MRENKLVSLSKEFSVRLIKICSELKDNRKTWVIIDQLLRSGTSIGANIHEGNYAASKADFINKFQIALKECYETSYWLDIFKNSEILSEPEYKVLCNDCNNLRRMLIKSITTAKER